MNGTFQLINALMHEIERQDLSKEEKEELFDYAGYKMHTRGEISEKDYRQFKLAKSFIDFLKNQFKED